MGGSIVLVGFMGAGKSTIGRALAKRLGFEFLDTDAMIVAQAGRSVTDIFRREGEAGFRKRESVAIKSLSGLEGKVIATGGGAPANATNAKLLAKAGPVVHLDVDLATVKERTKRTASRRPLLQGKRDIDLAQLLKERRKIYDSIADVTIDTREKTTAKIVAEIVKELL